MYRRARKALLLLARGEGAGGWDLGILFDWFKGNGAKLRAMMGA